MDSTPDSERANEAWDTLSGDSEASVDYADVVNLRPKVVNLSGDLASMGGYELPPTLEVRVSVRTPSGRTFEYSETREIEGEVPEDTAVAEEILYSLDRSSKAVRDRIDTLIPRF